MKIALVFLVTLAVVLMIDNASAQPSATLIRPAPTVKPHGNCACGDRVCVKTILEQVRGVIAAAVKNLIILIESEHLPRPPPCTGPARPCAGIKLPNMDDIFKSDGCVCNQKH